MVVIDAAGFAPGFADPVVQSQQTFRTVLDAMAHPGRIVPLPTAPPPPLPLNPAAYALCLTLVDFETPLWLDEAAATDEVIESLRFHCGCPTVDAPKSARFALIAGTDALLPLDAFDPGLDAYPDRSATLIIQVQTLTATAGVRLFGPGIADAAVLDIPCVPTGFWRDWRRNRALYPRGVDVVFAAPDAVAGLPRSIAVED